MSIRRGSGYRLLEITYRGALRLYPRAFRRQYGDEMVAVLRHRWDRQATLRPGHSPLPRTASLVALDLMRTLPQQRRWGSGLRSMVGSTLQDVRFAVRGLRKSPVFTASILATLALGIGANTAIFSVVNGVLLRPLPYPQPERLVQVMPEQSFTARQAVELESNTRSYEALALAGSVTFKLATDGQPLEIFGSVVGVDHLAVFGVAPVLGRVFAGADAEPGAEPVALISHQLWQGRFGGEPEIVGQRLPVEGAGTGDRTVIGVLPAGYDPLPWAAELLVPLTLDPGTHEYRDMARYWLVGRLSAEVGPRAAEAELRATLQRLAASDDPAFVVESLELAKVTGYREATVGDSRTSLLLLLGAVVAVLLIACANVANLLLARSGTRQREVAIRTALGAGRGRVIRQLLTESTILALLGGGIGFGLATVSTPLLTRALPQALPRTLDVHADASVLAFTMTLSVLSGLLFGLMPALRITRRPDLRSETGCRDQDGSRRGKLYGGLVAAEVALAVVLMVAAGLLAKTLTQLRAVDPGFDVENVYTLRVSPSEMRYADEDGRRALYSELLEAIAAAPGVRSVAAVSGLPLTADQMGVGISPDGNPVPPNEGPALVGYRLVTPDFFSTMGITVRQGRALRAADGTDDAKIGVINRALAHRMWPDESAIGKELVWSTGDPWLTVVGVVDDIYYRDLATGPRPEVYVPYSQEPWLTTLSIVVRAAGDAPVLDGVRGAIWAVDASIPISREASMEQVFDASVATPRSWSMLFGGFAGLALLLGCVGVFGVMAYTVDQRTHEIGVRLALGAAPRAVVRAMLERGMRPVVAGLLLGVITATLATRLLSGLLFEVAPSDPQVLAATVGVLAITAAIANLVPALRAARVDPATSLRDG